MEDYLRVDGGEKGGVGERVGGGGRGDRREKGRREAGKGRGGESIRVTHIYVHTLLTTGPRAW